MFGEAWDHREGGAPEIVGTGMLSARVAAVRLLWS